MKTQFIATPRGWQNLKPHPLSALTEFGTGIDLNALADHMRHHGYDQDEAIILFDDLILDGRHKLQAAILAEVTPSFKRFVGKNAMAYVAKKLFRQHLTISQRAMMAATFTKITRENSSTSEVDEASIDASETCEVDNSATQAQAAKIVNVSESAVDRASHVQANGTHELQDAVNRGTISVYDAAKVANEPARIQNKAVKDVERGKAKTASGAAKAEKNKKLPKSVANALADTWHAECARLLSKMRTECKSAFTWSSWLDASVLDYLKSAEDCFLAAIPRRICPECNGEKIIKGKSCLTCRQGGYLASQVVEA